MTLAAFTWTTRARPIVELGVGDSRVAGASSVWNVARWNDPAAVWAGVEPYWHDITCETFTARCEYGRDRSTDRFVAGSATVAVDNATGWADPNAVEDPITLTVRPGRAIRFGVDHDVYGVRWLYRGFVDAIVPRYDPDERDTVELSCVDALGEVGRAKWASYPAPLEYAYERAARILDAAKWPLTKRKVEQAEAVLVAADLAGQAADALGRTADSCGGSVYGDTDGNVAFRIRDWQTYLPDSPPDATIGNVDPADVCPTGWERPFERSDIATRVIVGRDRDTAYVLDDEPAQILYGIEPFERTDLWTSEDSRVVDMAERLMRTRASATAPRIRSVSLDARTSDAALDLMTTVSPYLPSRYRCRLRYPRGDVFDAEHLATGVAHELTPDVWTLDLNLDLAAPYAAAGGRWNGSYWNQATWATV